jgi:hypothetical protein
MINSDIHNSQGVDAFQPPANGNAPAKVGRNDPCPCGSGKKYKRCCLLKSDPPPVQGTPLTEDYGEVLRARHLFYNGNHTDKVPPTTRAEWDSMVKQHHISYAAGDEVWQDRCHLSLPHTREENLKFNQSVLMHELGHAIILVDLSFPIQGIYVADLKEAIKDGNTVLSLNLDWDAVLETARKQGLDRKHMGNAVLAYSASGDPITVKEAYSVSLPAGVLLQQRAIAQGLVPEWLHKGTGWEQDEGGTSDRQAFEDFSMSTAAYKSASDKCNFMEQFWEALKICANNILDHYDVRKTWQYAGEVVQQHDVRVGRPTRTYEMKMSKDEVEGLVEEVRKELVEVEAADIAA